MANINGTNAADRLLGTRFNDDIDGRGGNDRIFGLAGNDEIDGGAGSDLLSGGIGNDDLEGDAGNDRLFGGDGNDQLDGGRGNDVLTGGLGADRFEFERGDGRDVITDFRNGIDRLDFDDFSAAQIRAVIGGARQVGDDLVLTLSSDTSVRLQDFRRADLDLSDFTGFSTAPARGREIEGTNRADVLAGGAGNDEFEGRGGNDRLIGGGGHDDIEGDSGADRLFGGAGRDSLEGGSGNDFLTGGIGADIFEFERGDGRDVITDFRNGVDRIDLDDFSVAQTRAVINGARQDGDHVVLRLSADTSVTLANFQASQLDLSDFIL
ncbi:calcium-binding protein [Paracoccus sp. TK19116]|uniref:Calcium-binding protein n=1 Tax=Paracoccus albicereus TaxID=2922394 RepID=A0ABT1MSZ8_9RHOB|nr:calcium-binding protein [Paracoccus albicereus]MCQ0971443.1 calcium-binding protein [Paracoccus albicereus]